MSAYEVFEISKGDAFTIAILPERETHNEYPRESGWKYFKLFKGHWKACDDYYQATRRIERNNALFFEAER